jgi:hypothetical protein
MELYVAAGRHSTLQTWQQTGIISALISSWYIHISALSWTYCECNQIIIINTIHGYPFLCSTVTPHLTTPHLFRVDRPISPYFAKRFTETELRFSWNPFLANLQQSYSLRRLFKVKCLKRQLKLTFQKREVCLGRFLWSRLSLYFCLYE